jgi:hypothetical protein
VCTFHVVCQLGFSKHWQSLVLSDGRRAQVPHAPRDFWTQRARWAKAAHLYILDPRSVFWRRQPHMTAYQKSLYCVPLILHCCIVFTEPVMFTLPFLCVVFNICPYGIDLWLWLTHFLRLVFTFFLSTHADSISKRVSALHSQTSSRVLFFINVKAVLNTIMVGLGYKLPGAFKETKKAGAPHPVAEAAALRGGAAPRAAYAPSVEIDASSEGDSDEELWPQEAQPATAAEAGRDALSRSRPARGCAEGQEAGDGFESGLVQQLMNADDSLPDVKASGVRTRMVRRTAAYQSFMWHFPCDPVRYCSRCTECMPFRCMGTPAWEVAYCHRLLSASCQTFQWQLQ